MKVVSAKIHSYANDGSRIMDVVLVSDDTPDSLPQNGAGINGLEDTDQFAPLSVLYVVGSGDVYFANETGVFVKQ